ncbi:PREDICTED: zinc finger BED domain-containing protein RICESLEEPER 1-like isoform X2 [Ipomoea nil]|uniref:zinc finger BED domain-containing protein RICESLEEPER 1-like isoform X2 n=1 Tax=Ipomoea nil TaxID=35883 RepID=UPI0009010338|nr:PREDICTED: zinc finger BED domain-containing protein RICESLEEPER 1-like isoform X2 [Ipomoea nil]XP_019179872.1 PREDICTED: zinc finger BED domain-containing protein RICESLEEPER 1-like isoform X2 [Ipomoea nil]XP_019179873.1 PREDICTED: zinc finger BED domain-containing protein RICESLEEPER 1-like isoform X2 [Ipomoea nil]
MQEMYIHPKEPSMATFQQSCRLAQLETESVSLRWKLANIVRWKPYSGRLVVGVVDCRLLSRSHGFEALCSRGFDLEKRTGGSVKLMGENMKAKFEKYWGDIDKMNLMIFFANILDPKDKLEYMATQMNHMYGEVKGKPYYEKVIAALKELFNDYAASTPASSTTGSVSTPIDFSQSTVGRPQHLLKSQIKKQRLESGGMKKTELEIYLAEAIVEEETSFDILRWWKLNAERFPILSKIARDVLAIPISTVASESAFSTSGRILDPFRSSLTPKIVEALVCTQDWLRLPNTPLSIEENLEELERFEQEIGTDGFSTLNLCRASVFSYFVTSNTPYSYCFLPI